MPRSELTGRPLQKPLWRGWRPWQRGCLAGLGISMFVIPGTLSAEETQRTLSAESFDVVLQSGRVVWYAEALQRRLGVGTVPEAADRVLALETDDGQLVPLIEDLRTRAFRKDDQLRAMHVELRVRRYRSTPAVQILTIFELTDQGKFEIDYWCDVCAIPMYETGPCDCCQQENRLRKRPADAPQPQ